MTELGSSEPTRHLQQTSPKRCPFLSGPLALAVPPSASAGRTLARSTATRKLLPAPLRLGARHVARRTHSRNRPRKQSRCGLKPKRLRHSLLEGLCHRETSHLRFLRRQEWPSDLRAREKKGLAVASGHPQERLCTNSVW